MKAAIATRYGPPEVVQIQEVPTPTPNDNEILIKIHAASVSSGDARMRAFDVPPAFRIPARLALGFSKLKNPTLGFDLAGEVAAIGKSVTRYKVGDRVVGLAFDNKFGCHAEYKVLPEKGLIATIPDGMSYADAAAIPFGGLTALSFYHHAKIRPGQTVLVNGASGAVGIFGVQLAKYYGAEVTAVCSTDNVKLVQALGADHVIDYTKEDFTKSGRRFDVLFDAVGTTTMAQVKYSVHRGGYYLHAVMVGAPLKALWFKRQTGVNIVGDTPTPPPDALKTLVELVQRGALKVVIDHSYPFSDILEAHRRVDTHRKRGAVILDIIPKDC